MANILTDSEAANALRCGADDANMLDLLPIVDSYVEQATGRDWTADDPVYPAAKSAARMVLVRLHEDPGGMAASGALGWGLASALTQLEALALKLEAEGTPDDVLALVRHNLHTEMAITANLVLVFNHELDAGATGQASLENAAGSPVTCVKTLDATGKILTINPTGSLAEASYYTVNLDGITDIYGQTLTTEVGFWTA